MQPSPRASSVCADALAGGSMPLVGQEQATMHGLLLLLTAGALAAPTDDDTEDTLLHHDDCAAAVCKMFPTSHNKTNCQSRVSE